MQSFNRHFREKIPRKRRYKKSWLTSEMRNEAVVLFKVADSLREKRKLVRKWNSFHAVYKISVSSLYRWDRLIRMSFADPKGRCGIKKAPVVNCRRRDLAPSEYN